MFSTYRNTNRHREPTINTMEFDSINRNIRWIRKGYHMTQAEMAVALGISKSAYRDIENGSTRYINEIVFRLAEWSGIPAEEVVFGEKFSAIHNNRISIIREWYERQLDKKAEETKLQLDALNKQICHLRELINEKDQTISYLKTMAKLPSL